MAVLSWWDLSGRKIKTMKRFITSVLVQLSSPNKLWEDKMAESHLKPPNGCFMRRKNCSVFSLLTRQYSFYQSFSTISTIQAPQQSPKLARVRAGQFKIFERCRKKQIQISASLQGFMKVLWMMRSTCQWKQVLSLHPWLQGHSLLHKLLPNVASMHDPHKVNQNHVNNHLYPTRYTWCQWKQQILTLVLYKWQQKLRHFGSASWYRALFRSL